MNVMIIIIQTFTGATAYEFGPFPDVNSCEAAIAAHEQRVASRQPDILKMLADCRPLEQQYEYGTADGRVQSSL